jgi:hypothetical protein
MKALDLANTALQIVSAGFSALLAGVQLQRFLRGRHGPRGRPTYKSRELREAGAGFRSSGRPSRKR